MEARTQYYCRQMNVSADRRIYATCHVILESRIVIVTPDIVSGGSVVNEPANGHVLPFISSRIKYHISEPGWKQ